MAPWSPRPVLVLVLLLALLCSHIALCSSAESGKPKAKASGGRKALLASSAGDDGEEVAAVKPAKTAAAGKIKKKLVSDAKNQTRVAKAKKPESAATAKGTTKKTTGKAAAGGDLAIAKAKVPKVDKAAATKAKGADSAKPAKVSKTGAAKAVKPAKTAKSEAAAAAKVKKPTNLTADAGAKPAKSGKKAQVITDGKASAKVNATVSKEAVAAEVEEDVVFAEEAEGTDDLISEFRGLPSRLQETLMPDLARLSHQSKAYLSAANAGIADGVRPILGGRWAAAAASTASVALLLLPLCMLTALVRRMGPYLPLLHRALLLAQAYLAIYFATLALAAAATGLEPLRFFHAASPAAYAWTQAAQSLGFMGYLVLQMVDLVAVFSGAASPEEDGNGDATKALGLAQMVVGLAVGLHYYAAVFHRAASGEAPRANWRVYAVYAACFVIVCACARAERRKKAYLAGSGDGAAEEWKKS
ncbi:uncharacterized protein LOC133896433 [Phragmites australis]|uniref:uncharacterized protein LOC133896433 n=1 Tax=Phragmites australis TaxID=29695 RepID=UPI002D77D12E|nr:uncharacterized protein LOC133896433 [Phragmites australis]